MRLLWMLLLIDSKYCHCRAETLYLQIRYFQEIEKICVKNILNLMLKLTLVIFEDLFQK